MKPLSYIPALAPFCSRNSRAQGQGNEPAGQDHDGSREWMGGGMQTFQKEPHASKMRLMEAGLPPFLSSGTRSSRRTAGGPDKGLSIPSRRPIRRKHLIKRLLRGARTSPSTKLATRSPGVKTHWRDQAKGPVEACERCRRLPRSAGFEPVNPSGQPSRRREPGTSRTNSAASNGPSPHAQPESHRLQRPRPPDIFHLAPAAQGSAPGAAAAPQLLACVGECRPNRGQGRGGSQFRKMRRFPLRRLIRARWRRLLPPFVPPSQEIACPACVQPFELEAAHLPLAPNHPSADSPETSAEW